MLEQILVDNILITLIVWVVIYVADYYLTIYGARLYRTSARDYFSVEGSYELTPIFRKDVDALNVVSNKFLAFVALSIILIFLVWFLSVRTLHIPELFLFLIGALMLREGVVHLRHWRNIMTFRMMRQPDLVRGKIEYAKSFSLQSSAGEFITFAVFFLLLSLVVSSWFILGGALGCFVISIQHWNLARKAKPAPSKS